MANEAEHLRSSISEQRADGISDDTIVEHLLAGDQYFQPAAKSKVG